ncbi:hypothetical protein AAKU55_005804, partial [Oxalobacteraceae bacterium GrIS 1.11]
SSFILSTSHCYNIRRTLLINPVLRLEFETAKARSFSRRNMTPLKLPPTKA